MVSGPSTQDPGLRCGGERSLRGSRRAAQRQRRRDQESLPQAGAPASSGRQSRQQGSGRALQGNLAGERRPERSREAQGLRRIRDGGPAGGLRRGAGACRRRVGRSVPRRRRGGARRLRALRQLRRHLRRHLRRWPGRAGPASRGRTWRPSLEIDLLDAVRGVSTQIAIERPEVCATCGGSGTTRPRKPSVPSATARGVCRSARGPMSFTRTCPRCGGAGRIGTRACPTCDGTRPDGAPASG